MANTSDILTKLESISWMYSIDCQIHGKDSTLLLKYLIEEDFYAVMVTDLTLTYFERLEGKDIDEHYRRFNKGEVKRERLMTHLKTILSDVTKANEWLFETLLVDCHTSRLTLKVKNQFSVLKFDWSFYMISTNPDILSRHLTLPLLRLVSSLRHGVECLKKEVKSKDKLSDQLDTNANATSLTDASLLNKMLAFQKSLMSGADDNSLLISVLIDDKTIHSLLKNDDISGQCLDHSNDKSSRNNSQTNVKQSLDQNTNQGQTAKTKAEKSETVSQSVSAMETRKKSPTRQSKKLKL